MNPKEIRMQLEQLKGQRAKLQAQLSALKKKMLTYKQQEESYEHAINIVKEVGVRTQNQLQIHISGITSLALESVFDDPYKLEIEFVQRRNKTECDICFVRNENRIDPLSASGGGAVDVASFALRIASWCLMKKEVSNTIILDEPMRFVSENLRDKVSSMIKEISNKLGIQFIIVTHDPILATYADRVFDVTKKRNKSTIKII